MDRESVSRNSSHVNGSSSSGNDLAEQSRSYADAVRLNSPFANSFDCIRSFEKHFGDLSCRLNSLAEKFDQLCSTISLASVEEGESETGTEIAHNAIGEGESVFLDSFLLTVCTEIPVATSLSWEEQSGCSVLLKGVISAELSYKEFEDQISYGEPGEDCSGVTDSQSVGGGFDGKLPTSVALVCSREDKVVSVSSSEFGNQISNSNFSTELSKKELLSASNHKIVLGTAGHVPVSVSDVVYLSFCESSLSFSNGVEPAEKVTYILVGGVQSLITENGPAIVEGDSTFEPYLVSSNEGGGLNLQNNVEVGQGGTKHSDQSDAFSLAGSNFSPDMFRIFRPKNVAKSLEPVTWQREEGSSVERDNEGNYFVFTGCMLSSGVPLHKKRSALKTRISRAKRNSWKKVFLNKKKSRDKALVLAWRDLRVQLLQQKRDVGKKPREKEYDEEICIVDRDKDSGFEDIPLVIEEIEMMENGELDLKTILREEEDFLSAMTLPDGISRGDRFIFDGEYFDGLTIFRKLYPPPCVHGSKEIF